MESTSTTSHLKWHELRAAGIIHPVGVYYDMPDDEYRLDRSLSQSGIKALNQSTQGYWLKSSLNPRYQPTTTDAKDAGKAFDARVLGGYEALHAEYAAKPTLEMFGAGVLTGVKQLREKCDLLGLKKSGTLEEMAERIQAVDASAKLFPLLERDYLKKHDGKTMIDASKFDEIEFAATALELNDEVMSYIRGARRHVCIFWDDPETGVPMKAQLDAYKPGVIVDIKFFQNSMGKPIEQAVAAAITNYGHGVQAVAYKAAVSAVMKIEAEFVFVFQQNGDVPDVGVFKYRQENDEGELNAYYDTALLHYRRGIDKWIRCYERFGEKPWIYPTQIRALEDTDFPAWAFN